MVDRDSIELMIPSSVAAGAAPAGPSRLGGGCMDGVGIMTDEQMQAAHPAMMSQEQQAAADSSGNIAALAVLAVLVVGVVILMATQG